MKRLALGKEGVCGMLGSEPTGPSVGLVLFYGQSSPAWLSLRGGGESFLMYPSPFCCHHIADLAGTCCVGSRRQSCQPWLPKPGVQPCAGGKGEAGGGRRRALGAHVALAL